MVNSQIETVKKWMTIAGQINQSEQSLSLQIGLIAEEFSEIVDSLNIDGIDDFKTMLVGFADIMKSNGFDISTRDKEELLDGLIDLTWVSCGGLSLATDNPIGAFDEVASSNYSKFSVDEDLNYVVDLDANGKVKKGEGYHRPNLTGFVKG